jgi:hypothetical protein
MPQIAVPSGGSPQNTNEGDIEPTLVHLGHVPETEDAADQEDREEANREEGDSDEDEELDPRLDVPTVIARWAYPSERCSVPENHQQLLNGGLFYMAVSLLTMILSWVPFQSSSTTEIRTKPSPGVQVVPHTNKAEERVVQVVAMIPYTITEIGDPIMTHVEVAAIPRRVRELLEEHRVPHAEHGELGKRIRKAVIRLGKNVQ